jgi:hypothetical protein
MTDPDEPGSGGPLPDRLLPIAFVYSVPEAAALECTLRAYGIFALQPDYLITTIAPPWMVALGGIRVSVAASQWDDAIALLYEIDRGWTPPPNSYAKEGWLNIVLAVLILWYVWVPPPPRARGSYAWRRRQAEGLP